MKKTMTQLVLTLSLGLSICSTAQTTVTFDTFTLSPNSYYQSNNGNDFSDGPVTFRYSWATSWGGWESGSAYTNINDTVNGTYTNLYGCMTGTAFSGSNYATVQNGAIISFSNTTTAVNGFYITNTTYAWKEIKKGGFGRKFGDTTGTGSGTGIPQGHYPDWFKVLVKGYRGGSLLSDSVEFYLADYRPAGTANDYVVKNWQYVNCSSLGQVDSITFVMKSSDNNRFGMKTPAFFSIDQFSIQSTVGIDELSQIKNSSLFPNPFHEKAYLVYESDSPKQLTITISDVSGKQWLKNQYQTSSGKNQITLLTETLDTGLYFIHVNDGVFSKTIKCMK